MSIDLSHIPEEELHEYREIFGLVDEDGSGEIGKEEVAQLMQMLVSTRIVSFSAL